jgi:hypothetical protein
VIAKVDSGEAIACVRTGEPVHGLASVHVDPNFFTIIVTVS